MRDFVLKALDLAKTITRWLAVIAAVSIGIVMLVNFLDIVGTKIFLKSVPGALDISEELMVFLTLLPISFLALERGHIRITLVEEHLPLSVRYALQIIQYVIATLICGFLTWRTFIQFLKTIEVLQLKQGIDMPIWPANFVIFVSFGFLTLVWLLLLMKTLFVGYENKSV